MLTYAPVGYSQYTPLPDAKEARDVLNATWEKCKTTLLKAMGCDDKSPLKHEYSDNFTYFHSQTHGFIVKFDNKIRQRVGLTQQEENNIRKWNNLF
jgi:hypothetical protein